MNAPKFEIGTRFTTQHKHPKTCTVIDIWRTYNVADELVRVRYVATHIGPCGQIITDYDVLETTIARGVAP